MNRNFSLVMFCNEHVRVDLEAIVASFTTCDILVLHFTCNDKKIEPCAYKVLYYNIPWYIKT